MRRKILYQTPTILQHLYRGVEWRIGTSSKVVYLTFDDGPIPEVTPQLLDLLHREQIHATFFMVGDNARKHPNLARRVHEEGHRVANHTMNHLKGTRYCLKIYMDNVQEAEANILQATGLTNTTDKPLPFRPPYGKIWPWQKWALRKKGYKIYLWDILTHDYDKNYSPKHMLYIIKNCVREGSIINFHDSIKSGERMLQTVEEAIHYLKDQGYTFATL